jgi:ubiquitin-like modifier-activating enzyme ATG7
MRPRLTLQIWDAIRDETIYSCPSLLSSFYVISYADLKKYRFTYHFAYPVLHSDPSWTLVPGASPEKLSPAATTLLVDTYRTWRYTVDSRQHGFFLLKRVPLEPKKGKGKAKATRSDHGPGFSDEEELDFTFVVGSIASFKSGFFDGIKKEDRFVAFVDPSTYPSSPAWMLRNYLVLMRQAWELTEVQVLCYRDIHSRRERPTSIILRMQTTPGPVLKQLPKLTGWERYNNKLTHRVADLGSIMDPLRLADQSVDLNLKLIKWRIAPSLDLDVIKQTSCLLLGAGTLGSNVARYLMGWGVRKITFVDNSTVSFSNPVRQSLFRYKDSLNGGVKKALRAAEALEEIYPGVVTRGELLSVPMVGHAILDEAKTKEEFDKLRDLIYEHDVVFLLFDSRESRWLPTLMAKAAGKLVLNAALGFESFVVMRQGLKPNEEGDVELGCYFCNDVFAPGNVSSFLPPCPSLTTRSRSRTPRWTSSAPSPARASRPSRPPCSSSCWLASCSTRARAARPLRPWGRLRARPEAATRRTRPARKRATLCTRWGWCRTSCAASCRASTRCTWSDSRTRSAARAATPW